MLKTRLTFRKKKEINKLFRSAKKLGVIQGLDIRIAPKQSEISKILVVTSRSVGTAPVRNRIRRRIKELFKLIQSKSRYDGIIIVKKEATQLTFDQLKSIIHTTFAS